MKKLILITAILITAKISKAQENSNQKTLQKDSLSMARDTSMKDYISMQGGQMIVVKNEKAGRMTKDMTMKNGTVVKMNGEVKTSDGHSFRVKEGDRIYMNGRIEGPSKSPM